MKFAKFNKTRFDYDAVTMEWGKDKYIKVADLFDNDNPDKVYIIRSAFIIKKDPEKNPDMINEEEAVVTIDDHFVNVPHHQLPEVQAMLADSDACDYINKGMAGFVLRPYETSKRKELCYQMKWVDVPSGDEV